MNGRPYRFEGWNNATTPGGINDYAEALYQLHSHMKQSNPTGNSCGIQWLDVGEFNFRQGYCIFVFDEYAGLNLPKKYYNGYQKSQYQFES